MITVVIEDTGSNRVAATVMQTVVGKSPKISPRLRSTLGTHWQHCLFVLAGQNCNHLVALMPFNCITSKARVGDRGGERPKSETRAALYAQVCRFPTYIYMATMTTT